MTLAALINWLQTAVAKRTLRLPPVMQYCGFPIIWAGDFIFGMLNKIDVSLPSSRSRIDRIIRDAQQQASCNQVPNEQKLAIVTGANSGIGYETAKALGRAGYRTILACRNPQLGAEAIQKLERQTGLLDRFEFKQLDLASFSSIDEFVKDILSRGSSIDILVNNAGVMACPLSKTTENIEMQFGTNHVGHFILTMGLLEQLKKAQDGARILIVSSIASFLQSEIDYTRIEQDARYHHWRNYGISKLANLLFTTALARKLQGSGITVNALHPGTVFTPLHRHVSSSSLGIMAQRVVLDDVFTGALTSIYLALSPEVQGQSGLFYARGVLRDMHPNAMDQEAQDKLWEYTENLIAKRRGKME
ncbi:hypothetical protein IWW36_001719 [Coemansia brasiliensis]|uniref:Uncharacterized protein n=1 Tax=Coemansia brasiliensis TaxID=2650707 RepID=A0A9W8IG78_9FUNG|nr:hypothetical protein IWW36_001719 [Coemansia brasiliensis]